MRTSRQEQFVRLTFLSVGFCVLSTVALLLSAISLLKGREPGAFIIRDSHSFRGAYGLAMKVACPPPTVQQNKKGKAAGCQDDKKCGKTKLHLTISSVFFPVGDVTNELVRHFLIETSAKGVRLKGCPNEPYFGECLCRRSFA